MKNNQKSDVKFGDVFTPLSWAELAVEKFNIFEKWINGATIFDPTMGEGNLLESLVEYGLKNDYTLESLPLNNLFGNEINTEYYVNAVEKFRIIYGVDMSSNFSNQDFMDLEVRQYDFIFGNPPWQNYVDLPENYKEMIKSHYEKYGLFVNKSMLLLGRSRIDISALVIFRSIKDFLKENGSACFFMPLTLLLNDGANDFFRKYEINDVEFSIDNIYDPGKEKFFCNVATRYCIAGFKRDKKIVFPIDYFLLDKDVWTKNKAQPLYGDSNPLSVFSELEIIEDQKIQKLNVKKFSMPRQGINTCGANDIYIFNKIEIIDNKLVKLSNKKQKDVILPREFVFPLLSSENFKTKEEEVFKWVLLPYNKDCKLLTYSELEAYPDMKKYLITHKNRLMSRKGVLINAKIKEYNWWSLLGIGKYNFAPYKVVWESYGRDKFNPIIFSGDWQVNQSLQAYMPANSLEEAVEIFNFLSNEDVEKYLLSQKMAGTMNWAQPGRIKKLLEVIEN